MADEANGPRCVALCSRNEAGGKPMEHLMMASSVVMLAPCLALYFTMQRYFVRGVVMTGIKG